MPTIRTTKQNFDILMGQNLELQYLQKITFDFGVQLEYQQIQGQIELRLQSANNRPDLLSIESLARALKIYMNKMQTPKIKLSENKPVQLIVQKSVQKVRPYVVAAILRDINLNKERYDSCINFQDKLHTTICRNRSLVSIGTHDLDSIQPPFFYKALHPQQIKFKALNKTQQTNALQLFQDLQQDLKLKHYLHLLANAQLYPYILDSKNRVCSLPPIINGDHSKISMQTKNMFIEVTAIDKKRAMKVLQCLVWAWSEWCSHDMRVQQVQVIYEDCKQLSPELGDSVFEVSKDKLSKTIGVQCGYEQMKGYLKRMGLQLEQGFRVNVPFWRSDIIDECDICQDYAIAYGYNNIKLQKIITHAPSTQLNKTYSLIPQLLAAASFTQLLNFVLISKIDLTTNIATQPKNLITIQNPQTFEFQTARTTLLPGMLKNLSCNRMNPVTSFNQLPYKVFEMGDCVYKCEDSETGAINVTKLCVVIIDEIRQDQKGKSNFSYLHGVLDYLMSKLNKGQYQLKEGKEGYLVMNQQGQIWKGDQKVGVIGVLSGEVLCNFGLQWPGAMLQIQVQKMIK